MRNTNRSNVKSVTIHTPQNTVFGYNFQVTIGKYVIYADKKSKFEIEFDFLPE